MKMRLSQRGLRWVALPLLMALPGVPAYARAHHTESWARDHFAAAERMREALNGRPPADRTRHDYQRVIDSYRNVYFGAPTSTKADPSVVAVAETLVEMGRHFDDDKILHEAIAQYKFLRKEYPGSKYRCDALFTIGEIYKDDLNDPEDAKDIFQEFLHRYPQNRLVEDAQQAVLEIDRQAAAEKKAEAHKKQGKPTADKNKTAKETPAKDDPSGDDAKAGSAGPAPTEAKADTGGKESSAEPSGRLPRVTGIRHWSTPDYTRVAIDLESDIKFGSQRIANPDRIFFDLRGTKLASTLVGKSFDVDDGFLKKIRVAQFQPGRTRVVLEVDDLSDYEAFLLPNPYRLIIDIHGKGAGKSVLAKARKDAATDTADVEMPPKAGSKADASKDVPKDVLKDVAKEAPKEVPKAELKADLKALTGKSATKREQIHDDATSASTDAPEGGKADLSPDPAKTAAVVNKGTTGTVKKVIVEADDDDDAPPVQVSKGTATVSHSHTSAATSSHRTVSAADPDATVPEEKATDDSPSPSSARSKSLSHLSASRKSADPDTREARPTASGDRSLIRALGLKIGRIVIDPGHGGHDTGTIGPEGLQEKDLVLEVGRRLGKLLETPAGSRSRLHAQGRYFHSARNPDRNRQPAAGGPVHFDPRQFEPGFRGAAASRPIT